MSDGINNKKLFSRKLIVGLLVFCLLVVGLASPQPAKAQAAVTVLGDIPGKIMDFLKKVWDKAGSSALNSIIRNTLNRIALDTASYIGSGGKGQKPMFVTKSWGDYAKDLADNAAGEFIDNLNTWQGINLCEPDLDIKAKIGLGLVSFSYPSSDINKPRCTFSQMKKAWEDEYQRLEDMRAPDYLKKMSTMFDPTGSDLSVSLSLMTGVRETANKTSSEKMEEISANEGWLDIRDISGKSQETPGNAKRKLLKADETQTGNLAQYTGQALTDAANVFLNQLAISAFDTAMKKLTSFKPGNDEGSDTKNKIAELTSQWTDGLGDVNADPYGMISAVSLAQRLTKIIKPRFDTRGDYTVLAELTICEDASKPGPTNCVLDDNFRQAIEEQKTVIEAINDGYLNKSWRMKRDVDYNQGYSLRSASILRKYRILPVGWEAAIEAAEANNAQATLIDMVSCYDPNDNYNEFSQGFVPGTWCQGFVDPNWVLKAPLNYCKKQGYGGQIVEKIFTPADSANNVPASLSLIRMDNYCADDQTCIKEKADGSCEAYGYCTEEKRSWNFDSESCDPVFNTCQTFVRSNGSQLSFLENTLNYASCTSENAGCRPYATFGVYNSANDSMDWKPIDQIYFDRDLEICDQENEACTEYLRAKEGYGHNFLSNSNFERDISDGAWDYNDDSGSLVANGAVITTSTAYFSLSALELGGILKKEIPVGPNDFSVAGQSYTLSFYSKNCASVDKFYLEDKEANLTFSTDWVYNSLTYLYPDNYTGNKVYFAIDSDSCIIDKIQLEAGGYGTSYNEYGSSNAIFYQKIIPWYLEDACYVSASGSTDYNLKAGAPEKCSNYARKCNAEDVGCNAFTSSDLVFELPARVTASDYCSPVCEGYDMYVQQPTNFNASEAATFIPKSATKCTAAAVGCNEFTNLDELAQGGEGREYYTYLKQCIKPDTSLCSTFYSWGNNNGTYQLKAFSLKKDGSYNYPGVIPSAYLSPDHTYEIDAGGNTICDETIYNLNSTDSGYNPDCRQYYNQAGDIVYRLSAHVITCSANCHPYRISEGTEVLCDSSGGAWDPASSSCIYNAIPGEGNRCSANQVGCREYTGNKGNNVKMMANLIFDNVGQELPGLCNDSSSLVSDSINKEGKSLFYDYNSASCSYSSNFDFAKNDQNIFKSIAKKIKHLLARIIPGANTKLAKAQTVNDMPDDGLRHNLGYLPERGASYVIKFLAKSSGAAQVDFYLSNGEEAAAFGVSGESQTGVSILGDNEWHLYQVNLPSLDHEVAPNESLLIHANRDLYLDNIVLSEIPDVYYLIKGSWVTPDACYYDTFGNYQGINYNLGCSIYKDQDNTQYYLRHFNRLCKDSSVGCELIVDTKNTLDRGVNVWNEDPAHDDGQCDINDGPDCVQSESDEMIYAIFDRDKQCNGVEKGCSRMGQLISSNPDVTTQNIYADVYVRNNPGSYTSILCAEEDAGCEEWKYTSGETSYFKSPGIMSCEWRAAQVSGTNVPKRWYKIPVKRCDFDNNGKINIDSNANIIEVENRLCTDNGGCMSGALAGTCITDTNDYLCPVEKLKTIGYGGLGNNVYQPASGWAGLCEANASGCTEYIDPVSEFTSNLVSNPSWEDTNKDGIPGDGWSPDGSLQIQVVPLLQNKLYGLSVEIDGVSSIDTILTCDASIKQLLSNNTFSSDTNTIVIPAANSKANALFYSQNNTSCKVSGAATGKKISIKPIIIEYQIVGDLDKSSCNGEPNLESGCIMFNERRQNGSSGLSSLNSNAYKDSYENKQVNSACISSGVGAVSTDNCDTNTLVKVKPNRICNRWLSCLSMSVDPATGEETCYVMGECDKLNDFGRCINFSSRPDSEHLFSPAADVNITGYSKLGYYYLASMFEVGQDIAKGHWDFENDIQQDYWWYRVWDDAPVDSNDIILSADSPSLISKSKIEYPAHGIGFLKIDTHSGYTELLSDRIPISLNTDYYVNFLINVDSLPSGASGRVNLVGFTFDGTNFNAVSPWSSKEIAQGGGWQRIVIKYPANPSATYLRIEFDGITDLSNQQFYVDDVNIEPVLKTGEDSYVAKSCRLYPTQESLTCQSANANSVANGLEGYCLEADPKDKNSCLMWYPIDNIKASQVNNASSGFGGYGGITNPSYCAEVSANFDFVEKRTGWKSTDGTYFTDSNCGCPNNHCITSCGSGSCRAYCCPGSSEIGYTTTDASGDPSKNEYHTMNVDDDCWSGTNGYWSVGFCNYQPSGSVIVSLPTLYNNSGNNAYCSDNQPYTSSLGYGGTCFNNEADDDDDGYSCSGYGTDGGSYDNIYYTHQWNVGAYQGWYKYDGSSSSHDSDNDPDSDKIGIFAYAPDYTEADCISMGGSWKTGVEAPSGTGCLITDISKFTPKCTKFIKVETPWVDRLTSFVNTISNFFNYGTYVGGPLTSYGPFGYYKASLSAKPFAAALLNNNSQTVPLSALIGIGTNQKAGAPYSCNNSNSRTYKKIGNTSSSFDTCNAIVPNVNYDVFSVSATVDGPYKNTGNLTNFSGPLDFARKNIRQLFLKGTVYNVDGNLAGSSYNYDCSFSSSGLNCPNIYPGSNRTKIVRCIDKPGNTNVRPDCTAADPSDNSECFCAVEPTVENIKLTNSEGALINPQSPGVYRISASDFYTLTFNLKVDKEQLPGKSIYIDWGDNTGATETSAVDPGEFRFLHRYSPMDLTNGNDYNLRIRVEDNWGVYKCYGLSGGCDLDNCCKNKFSPTSPSCNLCN